LRESLRADKPDRDKILKQVQDISALRGEMMRLNVEAILSAKTVLSAEQQRKAFSLFENLREGGLTEGQGGDSGATSPPKASPPEIPLHPGEPPVQ
jgi:Spy/CpxP family protein refolding chaperone